MRTEQVIAAFLSRKKAKTPTRDLMYGGRDCSISTDGARLWSYSTIIAQWSGDVVLINNTKYSRTNSKQQSELKRQIEAAGIEAGEL